jgi:adenylate cyclase
MHHRKTKAWVDLILAKPCKLRHFRKSGCCRDRGPESPPNTRFLRGKSRKTHMGSLRVTISTKLVLGTISLILVVSLAIAYRNSQLFESTFSKSQYDINAELANSKSTEVETLMVNYIEKVKTVSNFLLVSPAVKDEANEALKIIFQRDQDLVNIEIYQIQDGRLSMIRRQTNTDYLNQFEKDDSYIEKLRKERPFPVMSAFADGNKIHIRNSTIKDGLPLLTIVVPFRDESGVVQQVAQADIRLDRLQKAFAISGIRKLYLVDSEGRVMAHSDDKLAVAAKEFRHIPIVNEALTVGDHATRGQKRFLDPELKRWFVGAYSKTAFDLTVISQAPEDIILEPARMVKTESYEIAGYVLSGALFIVILFSLTLTSPLEELHEATIEVARGNFATKAHIRANDEVGDLAHAFNLMVGGLKERDKAKQILNKFHGSSVTADLLQNDLVLGGSRKDVTVFFSDIRGFTKFSEGHTPEEVVEMLNEYFQIMVSIIVSHHGIVDKFVGDAIMAVWGAPQSTGKDAQFAVQACIEIRKALAELNEKRTKRGHTAIMIGMGLHSGPAISGKIGSTERMEYTVIGDTVNMASRIEASTKAFGADLLISQTIAAQVDSSFLVETAGSAEVKGKSEPILLFKVRGTISSTGQKTLVQTAYSDYEAEHADKVKIA